MTWCRERDITVLATWPNICYWKDYEIHESFENAPNKILKFWESQKVQIVGSPRGAMFPMENFYDTMYHLNKRGADIRTNVLIKDLSETIDKSFDGNLFGH